MSLWIIAENWQTKYFVFKKAFSWSFYLFNKSSNTFVQYYGHLVNYLLHKKLKYKICFNIFTYLKSNYLQTIQQWKLNIQKEFKKKIGNKKLDNLWHLLIQNFFFCLQCNVPKRVLKNRIRKFKHLNTICQLKNKKQNPDPKEHLN